MRSSIPDRSLIREYLLGRLDDNADIESDLSENIFLNDELCATVDTVEDEIIEEYLDGVLNPADRSAVDAYFLTPPARKEKLRFAELMRHYFDTGRGHLPQTPVDVLPAPADQTMTDARRATHWTSQFSPYGLAALVLLGFVGLLYMRMNQKHLESELAQVQKHNASLEQEARISQSSMALLTLVSDLSRGGAEEPAIDIKPSTPRIIVEIALQAGISDLCDVHLKTKGGKEIWSAKLLPIISPSGDARLMFDVPTQGIESGRYSFVVSSGVSSPRDYGFNARVTQ